MNIQVFASIVAAEGNSKTIGLSDGVVYYCSCCRTDKVNGGGHDHPDCIGHRGESTLVCPQCRDSAWKVVEWVRGGCRGPIS